MPTANPLWDAPRIHGELLKLGIAVSQSTVAKYMRRAGASARAPPRRRGRSSTRQMPRVAARRADRQTDWTARTWLTRRDASARARRDRAQTRQRRTRVRWSTGARPPRLAAPAGSASTRTRAALSASPPRAQRPVAECQAAVARRPAAATWRPPTRPPSSWYRDRFRQAGGWWARMSVGPFADVQFQLPPVAPISRDAPQFERADLRDMALERHRNHLVSAAREL